MDRLRSFLDVDAAGGIANAAPGDAVKQSQFSRQIKELEEFFGVELIRRKGKGIEITRIGKELARLAREHFSGLGEFQIRCKEAPSRIALGAGDSLLHWIVIPRLGAIQTQFPKVGFRLNNLRSSQIVNELYDMTLDFGIIRDGVEARSLKKVSLGSFDYAFYVPQSMAGNKKVMLMEDVLKRIPLATQGSDGSFRQELEAHAWASGFLLNIRLNCESFPQALYALNTGEYAAVLPTFAEPWIDFKKTARMDVAFLKKQKRSISLAWNPRLMKIRPLAAKIGQALEKAFTLKTASRYLA